MNSFFAKRCLEINSRKVHVSIERIFWTSLDEIANAQATTASTLVASIDSSRAGGDLRSAIRAYVLDYYRDQMERLSLDEMGDAPAGVVQTPTREPRWLH
jgi:predicted DNA-binding ribbon-helix-helix protein